MKTLLLVSALFLTQSGHQEHGVHSEKLGNVRFETSCTPAARPIFLRGLAWLHSFEYELAEGSFNEAAAADPSCGIAHWGVAMSLYHPLWAPPSRPNSKSGAPLSPRLKPRRRGADREKDYVAAIATFYRDSDQLDHKTRALAYNVGDEGHFTNAIRPTARPRFFMRFRRSAAGTFDNDPTFAREKDAAAILNAVLEAEPDHPGVAHYLIHSFDYPPLAELAVSAAKRYARIAPASAARPAHALAHFHPARHVARVRSHPT